tara:strand:- start:650 stop:1477 length:828 start_codon:yes stop_codon:yes gene_type:complete
MMRKCIRSMSHTDINKQMNIIRDIKLRLIEKHLNNSQSVLKLPNAINIENCDSLLQKYYRHQIPTMSNVQSGGFSSNITRQRALIGYEVEMLTALHYYYTSETDDVVSTTDSTEGSTDSSSTSTTRTTSNRERTPMTSKLVQDIDKRTELLDEVLELGVQASPHERLKQARNRLSKINIKLMDLEQITKISYNIESSDNDSDEDDESDGNESEGGRRRKRARKKYGEGKVDFVLPENWQVVTKERTQGKSKGKKKKKKKRQKKETKKRNNKNIPV